MLLLANVVDLATCGGGGELRWIPDANANLCGNNWSSVTSLEPRKPHAYIRHRGARLPNTNHTAPCTMQCKQTGR